MQWTLSHRCSERGRALADRHYNRQSIGADNFVPPGRCLVLVTADAGALWVTSWPFAQYAKHAWAGAWVCSAFRREYGDRASDLIRSAVAATRWRWPNTPTLGMITFVNRGEVKPKRDPGRCFVRAGFRHVGETAGGLLAFRLSPDDMPPPEPPMGASLSLFDRTVAA